MSNSSLKNCKKKRLRQKRVQDFEFNFVQNRGIICFESIDMIQIHDRNFMIKINGFESINQNRYDKSIRMFQFDLEPLITHI